MMELKFEAPQKNEENKMMELKFEAPQKNEENKMMELKFEAPQKNKENKRMELKFEAPWKNDLLALDKYDVSDKDKSITFKTEYPRHPVSYFQVTEGFDFEKAAELTRERDAMIAKTIANDIIIPDPAPQMACDAFMDKYPKLEPILVKDSVQSFLRFFKNCSGQGMSWNLTITAQTLTCIVSFNALRCAKVVLDGMAPELNGMHANPNCINIYGYFALHEAAERFSVDMIKLLLRHGASPNVRTAGNDIIENLLPLHVAVENTCLHKYLEDNLENNLSRSQNHLDYIYKLIHLLCLPEMKVFLDTIRLLAEKTNNLLQELWNYIEDGKIIQSAVLLLAAQEQIRGGSSSKINGSSKKNGFGTKKNGSHKKNGFDIINKCIVRLSFALKWEKGSHGMAPELLEERKTLTDCAWLLVDVISHTGEDLSAYIQAHSEVHHEEVFQHVSSILKEYGFRPTGYSLDTLDLRPYDCRKSDRKSCKGFMDANVRNSQIANLDAAEEKVTTVENDSLSLMARHHTTQTQVTTVGNDSLSIMARQHTTQTQGVRKKAGGGWDPTYTKRSFFPYWRSVLLAQFPVRVYPAYASAYPGSGLTPGLLLSVSKKLMPSRSTPTPNHELGSVRRISLTSNSQPRRCFITAATGTFRLLKALK